MRVKLVLVTTLFFLPLIYGSSEHLGPNLEEFRKYIKEYIKTGVETRIPQPDQQKTDDSEYPDTNNYVENPVCGNTPLDNYHRTCYCGMAVKHCLLQVT